MITGKKNSEAIIPVVATRLTRAQFQALIPHSGPMCLIDSVESWDEHSIVCLSGTHSNPSNPLRSNGELSSMHLIEYGAQAMAIHAGLLHSSAARGVLAALRNVRLYVDCAEHLSDQIQITAIVEAISDPVAVYNFEVSELGGPVLVEARATVINQ
ncbi:MAG: hypothetical protein ACRERS_10555 [Methylococcales bacterium]